MLTGSKTALVTGCRGQDGSYLAELLAGKGYRVVGTTRPGSGEAAGRGVDPGLEQSGGHEWAEWTGLDQAATDRLIEDVAPDEVYNLAAFASGQHMWSDPVGIGEVNGLAVARLLEAVRRIRPQARLLQASSSEVFGQPSETPQHESSRRNPRSPYGAAKLYADHLIGMYRDRHALFACSAILFNHESVRRGLGFVTRKICRTAAAISLGLEDRLVLGNLEARRDWGFAGDYVRAMWLMLQADEPRDFVVATGVTHSVRDLCRFAFEHVDLDYAEFVTEDPALVRAAEPVQLVGDAARARDVLQWVPEVGLESLIHAMVAHDLTQLRHETGPADRTDDRTRGWRSP